MILGKRKTSERNESEPSETKSCCVPCCYFKKKRKNVQAVADTLIKSDNTNVPYADDLPKNVKIGTCIAVSGLVNRGCSRFSVNLVCGKGLTADIAFHINPRLAQRYVVRNCRINGQWGDEETTSIVKFDLKRDKKFDLNIFITDGEFLVSLNGKHICAFGFRVPLSKVTAIEVHGSVQVYGVEYRELKIYPESTPENVPFIVPQGERQDELSTEVPDIPITGLLPRGFRTGWQLEICGRVKILPHSFYINLQEGPQLWPHPIIPLHLNPRFNTMYGKHLFVRNAWIDGGWGQEERVTGFQFSPGSPFTIAIRREDDHFSVWVDGQLAGEFKFRGAVDKIDAVYIHGDVVIRKIQLSEQQNEAYKKNVLRL